MHLIWLPVALTAVETWNSRWYVKRKEGSQSAWIVLTMTLPYLRYGDRFHCNFHGWLLNNQDNNSHDPMLLPDGVKLFLLFSLFWWRTSCGRNYIHCVFKVLLPLLYGCCLSSLFCMKDVTLPSLGTFAQKYFLCFRIFLWWLNSV